MFKDRNYAGRQLAKKLEKYRATDAVVLALPRGGVVTGYEVARKLKLPLDIVTVRKIGHPENSEYAIGAVDEHGMTLWNEPEISELDLTWLGEETQKQRVEALRRAKLYRGRRKPRALKDKIAILVDDGIATSLTMRLAVRVVKAQKPKQVIVAVPVAPPESVNALKKEGADNVIVLEPPERYLGAVGAHYTRFEQVEDDEVIRLLRLVNLVRSPATHQVY